MIDVIVNTNTVLIMLGVGTLIWLIRQVLPDRIENHKVWKIVLRIAPVALGVGFAMIPALRPMEEVAQSAVVGGVAGSLSASTYGIARELFGNKIKLLLGARATRKRLSTPPPEGE